VRNAPSFRRSIDYRGYTIELHSWRSGNFATFIYEASRIQLIEHFTGPDLVEVIRKALVWCEDNS